MTEKPRETQAESHVVELKEKVNNSSLMKHLNLEDGILRARFRNSREREELMEPGTVYRIEIDLWATANRFAPGHRIRLDISSSNFPFYDVNPNTGERLGAHTHMKAAINTVYRGPRHPSALVLPVIHRGEGR